MAFDIKKLNLREKYLLGILLLVVSTLPFFQFTLPAWKNFNETRSKTAQDKIRLRTLDTRISKLEKLKNENVKLQKKVESQKLYLAKTYEIDFLVQDLKKICDESSISLESFTPTNPEPVNIILEKQTESGIKDSSSNIQQIKQALAKLKEQELPIDLYRFPIEVKVTGNFTDVIELFKKLEGYGRVISVENISIGKIQAKQAFQNRLSKAKPKKETADTGSLVSTFDLIAYSLPSAEEKISVKQLEKSLVAPKAQFKYRKSR